MPWEISKRDGEFCVIKQGTDESEGCHKTRDEAADQLKALYASEAEMAVEEALAALGEEETPVTYTYSDDMKEFPWEGPIVFENVTTGDNRVFQSDSITWEPETLPWAFRWQKHSGQGHAGSVPVGRVDRIERKPDGSIYGFGVVIPGLSAEAAEYLNLLKTGVGGGVSVDGDSAKFEIQEQEAGQPRVEFSSMRLRALSAVDIPAFNGARIRLVGSEPVEKAFEGDVEEVSVETEELAKKKKKKGYSVGNKAMTWNVDDALVAAAIPVLPSTEAFVEPQFDGPTPLTVTQDGRVYGHLALFNTCHIGFPGTCVKPPKGSKYQYFHTGEIETAEGDLVEVGKLTFKTGHAEMAANPRAASEHYDNTGAVAADVRAGEDQFGIWVAGALRPHLTDEEIREFRAAPLSGDWRRIAGKLELVGALSVNTPGFPVPRVRALVASGETEALFTFLEADDDEFPSEYELGLRLDKKVSLAQRLKYSVEFAAKSAADFLNENLDENLDIDDPNVEDKLTPVAAVNKKDLQDRAENYTKAQLLKDLRLMRELLDDEDENIPDGTRKKLEAVYGAFIQNKDGKSLTASGMPVDEYYEATVDMTLEEAEEFYNTCHDSGGRFCPTPGGRGGGGVSGRAGGNNRQGGNRQGGNRQGGNRQGGNRQGGNKQGGNKQSNDRYAQHRLDAAKHMGTYKTHKSAAVKWAATAAVAYGVAALGRGTILPLAATLVGPVLASPAAMVALAGLGVAQSISNSSKANKARVDANRTIDNIRQSEKVDAVVRNLNKRKPIQ